MDQTVTEAYVFVDMPNEPEPVLAGRVQTEGAQGQFIYGKNYLSRPDAFAFDPINLPLVDYAQPIQSNDGIPAVLLDAGPDNWGQLLMQVLHTRTPQNKLESLLATKGTGVGALRVSLSRARPKAPPSCPSVHELLTLQDSIQELIARKQITPEMLRLLEPGSSMGGARPKSLLQKDDGSLWIAKFSRPDDLFDQSKAEQLCYLMMRDCGIDTAETELIELVNRSVLLVKRFDQTEFRWRRHYISGHALTFQPRVREQDVPFIYAYPKLADLVTKLSSDAVADRMQLFRRMLFNVRVGNTDDHMRNHGFLKNTADNFYRLSPAFDVVPQPGNLMEQAIGIGSAGRASSMENALSTPEYFGLGANEAHAIADEIESVVRNWERYADQCDIPALDRTILKQAFERFN